MENTSGKMAESSLETGWKMICMEKDNTFGRMVDLIKEAFGKIRNMGLAFTNTPIIENTKDSLETECSTEKAFSFFQMAKNVKASGKMDKELIGSTNHI